MTSNNNKKLKKNFFRSLHWIIELVEFNFFVIKKYLTQFMLRKANKKNFDKFV